MSAVWTYFRLDNEGSATDTCVCKIGILRGGKERAAFNTTNMICHLKNKHPAQYSEFSAAIQTKTLSQPTLKDTLENKEKFEFVYMVILCCTTDKPQRDFILSTWFEPMLTNLVIKEPYEKESCWILSYK